MSNPGTGPLVDKLFRTNPGTVKRGDMSNPGTGDMSNPGTGPLVDKLYVKPGDSMSNPGTGPLVDKLFRRKRLMLSRKGKR